MLFLRALCALFAYDVLSAFCSFRDDPHDGEALDRCPQGCGSERHRPCVPRGELRLYLVPETGSLSTVLLRHHVLAQKAGRRCTDGSGRTETALQGACLGRSRRSCGQRALECAANLRRLGSVLAKEIGMSVQAGVWNFDGRPIDRELIEDLSASLKQQGPDGESTYVDGSIALIYRPFHTTVESHREKQPYVSRRGFIFTWDGRLDNREVLIADLRGDLDASPTDLAIFAAAFDRWDTDCFRRIVGDWAVSIWKPEQRELLFAADYMAIRHVFYYLKSNQIWWSTDLSPLVLLSGDKFHIDDDYIAGYLAHDADAHLTPYCEIREVPPGQFVRISKGSASIERFWRFSPGSRLRYKTDAEYEEHFRHVFRQSVRRRLRSHAPILAELSGGLDSSSIVCMADDILVNEGKQFPRLDTISYYDDTEPNGDDSIYFQKIEQKRGRIGTHIDGSKVGSSAASLECSAFCPLPGALGFGQKIGDERADVVRGGGYRAMLSGIGGDEFTATPALLVP